MFKLSKRTITNFKIKFIKLVYRYLMGFPILWYSLTMKLTKMNSKTVRKHENFDEIIEDIAGGANYKKDPLNGHLDYLTHPSRLAHNVAEGLPFGDCDDHAIYWCTSLLKNELATKAWFCFYTMVKDETQEMSSHAICVFQSKTDGMYFWCDYGSPNYLDESRDKWCYRSAEKYSAKPVAAVMFEIESIGDDDTPKFGEAIVLKI
jgi:hypothetical protein